MIKQRQRVVAYARLRRGRRPPTLCWQAASLSEIHPSTAFRLWIRTEKLSPRPYAEASKMASALRWRIIPHSITRIHRPRPSERRARTRAAPPGR